MNDIKENMKVWMDSWLISSRKVTFPRNVCDSLRRHGTSAYEIQTAITNAMTTKEDKRTPDMVALLTQYLGIKKECENSIAEDVAESAPGSIFLLKAIHGLEDKQTLKVEDGNLADIIAKNSAHKANNG